MREAVDQCLQEAFSKLGVSVSSMGPENRLDLEVSGMPLIFDYIETPAAMLRLAIRIGRLGQGDLEGKRFLLAAAMEIWAHGWMIVALDAETEEVWGSVSVPAVTLSADALATSIVGVLESADCLRDRLEARNFDLSTWVQSNAAASPLPTTTRV